MDDMVHIVVCVDDTDDLSKKTSTGAVAEVLAREVTAHGGTVELGVTRHQLLLDPRVRYTSHNSAMAFTAWIAGGELAGFAATAREAVWRMRAQTSDPGLCLGVVPPADDMWLARVLAYGFAAQQKYFTVASAFELAEQVPWLQLESLGGNSDGVVGALAGIGLRLSGNDGRFRGKCDLVALGVGDDGHRGDVEFACARDVIECLSGRRNGVVCITDVHGTCYAGDEPVAVLAGVKPVLWHGALTLVVEERDGVLWPFAKDDLDAHDSRKDGRVVTCPAFVFDNDAEEYTSAEQDMTCANCLYRRLTATGFVCMRDAAAMAGHELCC